MSIRWKMTLFYSVLLAVLLLSFSGIVYFSLRTFLLDQASDIARSRAQMVDTHAGGFGAGHGVSGLAPGLAEEFASPSVYIQLLDQANRVAGRSANLGMRRLPVPPNVQLYGPNDKGVARRITISPIGADGIGKGEHLLVWDAPLREAGEQVGLVQVGVSLAQADALLRWAATLLAVGFVVVLSLSIPTGLILSKVLLKPVGRVTQTARAITAGDLSRRIDHRGPPDEVGQLAATFDGMIGTLDDNFRIQRRFLSDAGHELRTPVTTILGHANFLRRWPKADSDERQEAVDAIRSTAEHMSHLVNDLLQLASSDEQTTINLEPIALNDLLQEVSNGAREDADGLDIRLEMTAPINILGDRDQIRRLFTNLLDNAAKFTPTGGRVTTSLERVGDKAKVVVKDTGIGIPDDELPHIFERFYRSRHSLSPQRSGTGLGLAIVNKILLAHGGTIEVESEVGKGSTFEVFFTELQPARE